MDEGQRESFMNIRQKIAECKQMYAEQIIDTIKNELTNGRPVDDEMKTLVKTILLEKSYSVDEMLFFRKILTSQEIEDHLLSAIKRIDDSVKNENNVKS